MSVMAIIHILHIITLMSFIARNVSDVLPGVRDEDILLGYDAETPQLNIEAVSHAVDRLRYYYLF